MKKINILSIFGTRPEAIKMAPLCHELTKYAEFDAKIAVTGQHRQMLDQVLSVFQMTPDYDLDIMEKNQNLYSIVVRALERLEPVLKEAAPDLVLVHGDTSTAFIGALAAYYAKIPVGHVEAGLRTYDIYSPFPEEINRRLVAPIAALHFCPTEESRENLTRENITKNVFITGNTAIDNVHLLASDHYTFRDAYVSKLDFSKRIIFMTAHRRENYGQPMENIMHAVSDLVETYPDVEVVYPVHLSPVVREVANRILGEKPRVHLIEPLDFDDAINLIKRSFLVLTDSGGIQEEAPALGKPVLVLRHETERPEAIAAGTVTLAGTDRENIVSLASKLLDRPDLYEKMAHAVNPYGDGGASGRIAKAILHYFGKGEAPAPFTPGQ